MLKSLPQSKRRNAPWTPLQRRTWLATRRRRERIKSADAPDLGLLGGLVAHFGFDEPGGSYRMDNVGGYALAPLIADPTTDVGIIGTCVWFDTTGSYLLGTEDTTAFSPTANGFTVSVWVNFENTVDFSQTAYIASVWDDTGWPGGSAWQIFVRLDLESVSAELICSKSGFTSLSGTGNFSVWSHICLAFESATNLWTLYFNGVVVATLVADFLNVVGRLGVGRHTNPITPPPDCMVDELAIWSRGLSATEVAQLYNFGNGLPYESF